ncbi:MAG: DUF4160 domain-containing protein [Desulfamplus sp.]|nr:DUF4160 domain-containing protein [Desulfamplus sp.]
MGKKRLELPEGTVPKKIISLVLEWAFDHKKELMDNWELAKTKYEQQLIG